LPRMWRQRTEIANYRLAPHHGTEEPGSIG
jgi:hypothetical protein